MRYDASDSATRLREALALLQEVADSPGHSQGCKRARTIEALASMGNVDGRVGKAKWEKIRAERMKAAVEEAPPCDCLKGRVRAFLEVG